MVCHLWDLQSLIGTLQFACQGISPGQAFMQHIVNLSEMTFTLWHLFLDHWDGNSLFLAPYIELSPDIHLYTDAARGIGYGAILR